MSNVLIKLNNGKLTLISLKLAGGSNPFPATTDKTTISMRGSLDEGFFVIMSSLISAWQIA